MCSFSLGLLPFLYSRIGNNCYCLVLDSLQIIFLSVFFALKPLFTIGIRIRTVTCRKLTLIGSSRANKISGSQILWCFHCVRERRALGNRAELPAPPLWCGLLLRGNVSTLSVPCHPSWTCLGFPLPLLLLPSRNTFLPVIFLVCASPSQTDPDHSFECHLLVWEMIPGSTVEE